MEPSPIFEPSPSATDYADLFVAAVEGGINYWAYTDEYDWQFVDLSRNVEDLDPKDDYAMARITEQETGESQIVDSRSEKWHNAVANAASYFNQSIQDFIEDHDASSGDVAMQFAMFGEIIYG